MPKKKNGHSLQRRLKNELSDLGKCLHLSLNQIIEALEKRDADLAETVIPQIEALQVREDSSREVCLRILAMALGNTGEMRWTRSAHKVLSYMEESSAEIAQLAQHVKQLNKNLDFPLASTLPSMGRKASWMLHNSILTMLHADTEKALEIMEQDSFLDRNKEVFLEKAFDFIAEHPDYVRPAVPYIVISKHLERIGDHASHIAEEVIYLLQE